MGLVNKLKSLFKSDKLDVEGRFEQRGGTQGDAMEELVSPAVHAGSPASAARHSRA